MSIQNCLPLRASTRDSRVLAVVRCFAAENAKLISRLAFGSCADQDLPQPIWDAVRGQARAVPVLGDNIYADTAGHGRDAGQSTQLAAVPGYQKLKATVPDAGHLGRPRLRRERRRRATTRRRQNRSRSSSTSSASRRTRPAEAARRLRRPGLRPARASGCRSSCSTPATSAARLEAAVRSAGKLGHLRRRTPTRPRPCSARTSGAGWRSSSAGRPRCG